MQGVVTDDQLHDLGILLFSMSCFWMYTWYCQYMLIWFVNNPEETSYLRVRWRENWGSGVRFCTPGEMPDGEAKRWRRGRAKSPAAGEQEAERLKARIAELERLAAKQAAELDFFAAALHSVKGARRKSVARSSQIERRAQSARCHIAFNLICCAPAQTWL